MLRKIVALAAIAGLFLQQVGFAQTIARENIPGPVLNTGGMARDDFRPIHLRYLSYDNAQETVRIILDKGDAKEAALPVLQDESKNLLSYFLTGVTLPNDTFWVNLRPDTQERIIDPWLEKTDVGRVLLESDVQLKKDTAAFTSPSTPEGKIYWERLYKKAAQIYGSEKTSIPTLTRPWIVPGEIMVKETQGSVLVYKATLKVMLEQDYLQGSQEYTFQDSRDKALNEYASQQIRELIIPKLTREVNTAKRYASLRQVYFSLILSRWFKQRFAGKPGAYAARIDTKDLSGIQSRERWSKTDYFNQYRDSFHNGEYNIKEQITTPTGQVIRSYVSGGVVMDGGTLKVENGFVSAVDNAGRYGQVFETPAIDPQDIRLTQVTYTAAGRRDGGELRQAEQAVTQIRDRQSLGQRDGGQVTYIGDAVAKYTVEQSNLPLRVMYLRNGVNMHGVEIYLNEEYTKQELARFVLNEVYNRLTVFGAEEVVIDVDREIYDEFIRLFNTPINGRGFASIGSFLNIIYERSGANGFRIRQAGAAEFDSLAKDAPVYTPGAQDFKDLKGNYIGIDIGGSDIKVVVLNEGKVAYTYKENWSPNTFTSAAQHEAYFKSLIAKATAATGIALDKMNALGISFNLVVVNNRPTGIGPVIDGLKGEELERIKTIAQTMGAENGLPVYILNDGDAGALWSAVRENSPNTLALALGTGLAGGYTDSNLNVRSYLTEMGNVVLSLEDGAMGHSFSQVPGAAQRYLSQRLPFALAEKAGIDLSAIPGNAEKLVRLQEMFDQGDARVVQIFTQVAQYMAEYVLYINTMMPVNNVCLFGRVMSKNAGKHVLSNLQRIFAERGIPIKVTVPEGDMVEFAQAEGAAIYAAGNNNAAQARASSATVNRDGGKDQELGGIDFSVLPMNIQPMGSFSGASVPFVDQAELARINIDSEVRKLKKLVDAGSMPSEERINTLVAACIQKKKLNQYADTLLVCLSDILKRQEENQRETTSGFRHVLMIVDSQ